MATIPRYDEQRVSTNALSGQRQNIATPDAAFGSAQAKLAGDLGDIAGTAGDAMAEHFIKQQKLADDTTLAKALHDADNEYMKGHNEVVGASADYVGPGAKHADKGLGGALMEKHAAAYNAQAALVPERLRGDFARLTEKARMANESNALKIESEANTNFIVNTATNTAESARSIILSTPFTDLTRVVVIEPDGTRKTNVDLQFDNIDAAVDLAGRAKGLDSAAISKLRDDASSKVVTQMITNALDKDQPAIAAQLLGKYEEQKRISPDDAQKLRDKIEVGAVENEGILISRTAIAAKEGLPGVIAKIEKGNDPVRAEKLAKVVRQKFAEHQQVREFDMRAANEEGLKYMQDHKVSRPPSAIWDRMDPDKRQSIIDANEKIRRGENIITDLDAYSSIDVMISTGDPKMYSIDWASYAGSISQSDMKTLRNKVAATLKPEEAKVSTLLTERVSATIKSLGLSGSEEGAFRLAYNDEVAPIVNSGKPVTYEEGAAIIRRLTMKTGGYNKQYLYKIPKSGRGAIDLAIPEEDEKRIRKMLEESNAGSRHEIDDHDIQRQWHIENGIQ